jgi:hypothetical protein
MFIFSHNLLLVDCNRGCYRSNSRPCCSSKNAYLQQGVQRLWSSALATSTRKAYATGLRVFRQFLSFNHILRPIHRCMDERTLQTFISYCFYILHIRTSSIRGYLSALRYYCLTVGLHDPLRHSDGRFKFSLRTLLHATEKGQRGPRPCRLPIDIDILSRLCSLLNGGYFDLYWDCLLKASFCVAFFGFLRCGEFTTNSLNATAPVSIDDLTLTSTTATLFLQRSKSDRFHRGVLIRYLRTHNNLCPIRSLYSYLRVRSQRFPETRSANTPLFLMPDGHALCRTQFVKRLRLLLSAIGVDASIFSAHSFRTGAASTAANVNIPVYLIKILGRWSSSAYRRYLRVSTSTLAQAHSAMASRITASIGGSL